MEKVIYAPNHTWLDTCLNKFQIQEHDFDLLISDIDAFSLEKMAQKAKDLTNRHFGKTVQLYTPLYLANYCDNICVYCGFHKGAQIGRQKLDYDQVELELRAIYSTGIREVLLLTGDSIEHSPVEYIGECAKIARQMGFMSVGIEVYALETAQYEYLVDCGVNSLTIYQETYDESLYKTLHISGPKSDYHYRLLAPQRAAEAGIKQITLGPLYGLSGLKGSRQEAIMCFRHLRDLEASYPHIEWGVALPRLRPLSPGAITDSQVIPDRVWVQYVLAFRIAFPRFSIGISTRETAAMRQNMLHLGITKMSAGVKTTVGGYAAQTDKNFHTAQFPISDMATVKSVVHMLVQKGFQPIFCDWINNTKFEVMTHG